MELTEIQKKDLKRFSLILNSLNMEDGVTYSYAYYDSWEGDEPQGPFYKQKFTKELNFLPNNIKLFFDEIKENFDTGLFYNEAYGTETGSLNFTINAEKKMLIIKYTYYEMTTEDFNQEVSFKSLSESSSPFRQNELELKSLVNKDFLLKMNKNYGSYVEFNYDGSGDSGWVSDNVNSEKGSKMSTNEIENMVYEILDLYAGGWEINEGSSGNVKFNFDDQTVQLNHSQNIEDSVTDFYKTFSFS